MNKKSNPFTKAAAATLGTILFVSWVLYQQDMLRRAPWRGGPNDGDNSHLVEYSASSSALGISADIQFYNGVQMVLKQNVLLPIVYEVELKDGQMAQIIVEVIQNSQRDGEVDCDLTIDGHVASSDGDSLERMHPNVECAAIV